MKIKFLIWLLLVTYFFEPAVIHAETNDTTIEFDFYGTPVRFKLNQSFNIDFKNSLSNASIEKFYSEMISSDYLPVLNALIKYKSEFTPDDWLYYQLIRKTAQQISPKSENYKRYTLYKWFLLAKSGYDATLTVAGEKILFYVRSQENVYNIPLRTSGSNQYVCLNYHDYKNIDFEKDRFTEIQIKIPEATHPFSYKVTQLPDFDPTVYLEKELSFNYYQNEYHFKIKLNPQIKTIFANYPVVDYSCFFNIPLSKKTYASFIPLLKLNIRRMNTKRGIDYLMRFTRHAFLFETDSEAFGGEKRLSPEETLLYEHSDCEDRAALFFYLVKEIYDLPMIVLVYPHHVTIAIKLNKPVGKPVIYNGNKYSVCEPTPQQKDLRIGQGIPSLNKTSYQIAYAYYPGGAKSLPFTK